MKNQYTKVITMSCNEAQKLMFAMVLYSLKSNISIYTIQMFNNGSNVDSIIKTEAILLKKFYEKLKHIWQQQKSQKIDRFQFNLNNIELAIFEQIYTSCNERLHSKEKMEIDELESIIVVLKIKEKIMKIQNHKYLTHQNIKYLMNNFEIIDLSNVCIN